MISPYGALRTHGAGTVGAGDDGETVTLGGWVASRRDHGGVVFVDLRDRTGVVQVVVDPESVDRTSGAGVAAPDGLELAHKLRTEWVIRVVGVVRARPPGMENPALATGDVEVAAHRLEVLSEADTPPFPVEDGIDADETLRLAHRYVDLRRPEMAAALTIRARMNAAIRRVMERYGFVEVETPALTRPTPEGARDYLVPARVRPGRAYALPQSPQLFKQLLMVAGLERYYQLARCFRDEDLRADRQPEFTQLDVELSFCDENDVMELTEEVLAETWAEVLGVELTTPFPRLTHAEALRRYGTDKPDTRFGLELVELTGVFADTDVGVFRRAVEQDGAVVAVTLPEGGQLSRSDFDGWVSWAKGRGAKGLAWAVVEHTGERPELRSPLARHMSEAELSGLVDATGATAGDAVFLAAGRDPWVRELMGAFRVAVARSRGLIPQVDRHRPDAWHPLWVVRPPLFERDEEGRWAPTHHPFTAPAPAWEDSFEQAPDTATARAYDVVCNGVELGSGSIRIHRSDLQRRILRFLGVGDVEAEEKFGFLLRGFSYGVPPHGGIAPGLDRIAMLLAGRSSIREVIAFPKTQSGWDPLTDAPAPVSDRELDELGLRRAPNHRSEPDRS